MRIDRVHAVAFGPFVDSTLELAPGMNVVHGPNEAGKSSWHAALYAGLCGMRRARGRKTSDDARFTERHRPWTGDRWEVGVSITLDDERSIELSHDLERQVDCRAIDAVLGTDVSDGIMFDGSPDGAVFLGLTRKTLPATLCVRQGDVLSVLDNPVELQEALQRAAASGDGDATAQQALDRIEQFRRKHIGAERSNSTRPLMAAVARRRNAEDQLRQARDAHAEYRTLVARSQRAECDAAEAEARLAAVRAAVDARDVERLTERAHEARTLWNRFGGVPPAASVRDDERARRVVEALAAHRNRPADAEVPAGPSAAEIECRLAELPPRPDGDVEPDPAVVRARRQWERRLDALAAHDESAPGVPTAPFTGGARPEELRAVAEQLDEQPAGVDAELVDEVEALRSAATAAQGAPVVGVALGAGAALALVGAVVAAALGQLVAGVGLVLLAVGGGLLARRVTARHTLSRAGILADLRGAETTLAVQQQVATAAADRLRAATTRCQQWGLRPDAATLRDLATAALEADDAKRRRSAWEHRRNDLESLAAAAATELRAALTDRGAALVGSSEQDLVATVDAYEADCRARARTARAAEQRQTLEAELRARLAMERAAAERGRANTEADWALRRAAEEVGITATGVDDIVAALEAWEADQATQRERAHSDERAWQRLQFLLDGRSVDDLEHDLQRRRRALRAFPEDPVDLEPDVDAQVRRLETTAHDRREEAARLAGQVEDRRTRIPSVAESEEALDRAREDEERLRRLDATLATAHRFLSDAREDVHRSIAPRLQAAVSERLPRVTAGRYADVTVDPATLALKVREPGGGWRHAHLLSHGTTEQMYLLLRIAMAEHLCVAGESAPLILDDVTVQADEVRTRAILDLLHDISRTRQVVLFTQESEVLRWAETRLRDPSDRLIRRDVVAA